MLILEKYSYSVYGIGFDACRSFSSTYGSGFGKNVIIFCADMNSSVHIDNKKNIYLGSEQGPKRWFRSYNVDFRERILYSFFSDQQKKICLSFHYSWVNS